MLSLHLKLKKIQKNIQKFKSEILYNTESLLSEGEKGLVIANFIIKIEINV